MEITPLYFIGTRFFIAAILILWFVRNHLRLLTLQDVWAGTLAGLFLSAAFNLQVFGIQQTTPGKAGLFTGLTVLFVPIFYFIWSRRAIPATAIVGALLIFSGLALFSWKQDFNFNGLNIGDYLAIGGAVFFAAHVIVVDHFHQKKLTKLPDLVFVMLQLLVVGISTLLLAVPLEPFPRNLSAYGWYAYNFDMIIGTLLAYIVQIYAQKFTHPSNVSIILSSESLFAYLFSWLLWNELITIKILIGILLFVSGVFITEIGMFIRLPLRKKQNLDEAS